MFIVPTGAQPAPGPQSPVALPPTQCAWCLVERGQDLGNGSHGICQRHADQVLAEHRARIMSGPPSAGGGALMMRARQKQQPQLYPRWSRKDSPTRQAKIRDGHQCVACGIADRTLITDEAGQPQYILYLHGAHISYLDPQYALTEPIDGQRLRAMCPSCHKSYDNYWKPREAEVEHQRELHHVLLSRWLPDPWLQKRFLEVV